MDQRSIFDLSPEEKPRLVEDLWDDLAAEPENIPLLDWQIEELERREANLKKHPEQLSAWEDVKARIRVQR